MLTKSQFMSLQKSNCWERRSDMVGATVLEEIDRPVKLVISRKGSVQFHLVRTTIRRSSSTVVFALVLDVVYAGWKFYSYIVWERVESLIDCIWVLLQFCLVSIKSKDMFDFNIIEVSIAGGRYYFGHGVFGKRVPIYTVHGHSMVEARKLMHFPCPRLAMSRASRAMSMI